MWPSTAMQRIQGPILTCIWMPSIGTISAEVAIEAGADGFMDPLDAATGRTDRDCPQFRFTIQHMQDTADHPLVVAPRFASFIIRKKRLQLREFRVGKARNKRLSSKCFLRGGVIKFLAFWGSLWWGRRLTAACCGTIWHPGLECSAFPLVTTDRPQPIRSA